MESLKFKSALLILKDGAIEPDCVLYDDKIPPSVSHVISRNSKGETISLFIDNEWDFSDYDIKGRHCVLNFINWLKEPRGVTAENIIYEMKILAFIYIWHRKGKKYHVKNIQRISPLLNVLGRFAYEQKKTVASILESNILLMQCLRDVPNGTLYEMRTFLNSVSDNDTFNKVFTLADTRKNGSIFFRVIDYRNNLKQHPPIPSRIYQLLIEEINGLIDSISIDVTKFVSLVKFAYSLSQNNVSNENRTSHSINSELRTYINKENLTDFLSMLNIKYTKKGIAVGINSIYFICKLAIHLYTGMRDQEVKYLRVNCASKYVKNSMTHFIIKGQVTKLANRETEWITNEYGYKAVYLSSQISRAIASSIGIESDNEFPLFISATYLDFGVGKIKKRTGNYYPANLVSSEQLRKFNSLKFMIQNNDIDELKRIDPFREWNTETRFSVGKYWPLTTHQFRRSLALYATRSGMVSITSLKRQLQHLTIHMSLYYAKGSTYAEKLVSDSKSHFVNEYQDAQYFSQAVSYLNLNYLEDKRLYGAHGDVIYKNKMILMDRDSTMRSFKNGEICYEETILGGCTSTIPCDKKATQSLLSCLKCTNAIISESKLKNVIEAQQNMVVKLDTSTLMYRIELNDLDILKKYYSTLTK
ncbi:hypothetical protein [Klebsiella michiganensis]|uniref:hypothetical protein n=1 Tax=Klebsiella michiganensis TaxID=1134687 RepID=UPI003EE381A1